MPCRVGFAIRWGGERGAPLPADGGDPGFAHVEFAQALLPHEERRCRLEDFDGLLKLSV
jgi:hypothetical protein